MSQPHILVADDDPDNRDLLQFFLEDAGFRVSITGNPAEVLNLLSKQRFDAFLLDNWMPGITGVELCQKIRTVDRRTPILFCSGAATQADIKAATRAGAQGYLSKPIDLDGLLETLRSAIETADCSLLKLDR